MEKIKIKINNNQYYGFQNKDNNIPKNTIKDIKVTNNKKSKGYTRVFLKFIKRKNNILKHVLDNRFKKWKENALKGLFIRKKIIVRISLSRDNILKNKLNARRLSRIKDSNINKPKSEDKNLIHINKKNNKENHINNIKLKKLNNIKTPLKNKELSPEKKSIRRIYKNEKNSIFHNHDNEQNENKNNPIYSTIPADNQNIKHNKILVQKNKFSNNNDQNNKYLIKKIDPVLYTYEPNHTKNNSINNKKQINDLKNLSLVTSPRTRKGEIYNSYTNIGSNNKTPIINKIKINKENQFSNTNSNKSFSNIKNNFTNIKLVNKNTESRNTLRKIKDNKYTSIDSERKYINYTDRENYRNKRKYDKETLKKGVTTVIQHYLGVKERLDNYSLVIN